MIMCVCVGTAPGQAETYDYSSKMAASKEAAAAAASKVFPWLFNSVRRTKKVSNVILGQGF
jgi:hypothetical protein